MSYPDNDNNPAADTNQGNSSDASLGYIDRLRTAQLPLNTVNTAISEYPAHEALESEDATEVAADSAAANSDTADSIDGADQPVSMPHEARRALVSLMRFGTVLAQSRKNIFDTICQHQQAIRRHLAEVYLQLVLDERAGVAFIAGVDAEYGHSVSDATQKDSTDFIEDPEEPETASLITRRTLSLYDTLLLLVLRKHFQEREVSGEQKIMIDIERIESLMTPFLPLTNSERADRSKLQATIKRMLDKRLLAKVRGSDDRYEITPIIRYVIKAEFLESMLQEYYRLADDMGLSLDQTTSARLSTAAVNALDQARES